MIYIEERGTCKIPGTTSLFIHFDYNQDIKDILKQLDLRIYNKETLEWEVPINKLSYLIRSFVKYDKITLKVLKEEEKITIEIPQYDFKTKPFKHQLEAIEYGLNHESWMLLDDMGMGKTLSMIYLAEILHYKKQLDHCLIICGVNSLKYNWISEIEKHSILSYKLLGTRYKKNGSAYIGSVQDRIEDLLNPIEEFFIITNIETLRESKVIEALKKKVNNIDMVVFDEAHKAKQPTSLQGKNLLKLNWPKRKIALTGTVLLNSPIDSYTPLKWTNSDNSTFSKFKQQYCEYGGFRGVQIVGYKNLDMLSKQIKLNSLRRKKEDYLDLPEKTYKLEYVEMNETQSKFYNEIRDGVIAEVDKVELNPMYAMSLSMRLRQATAWSGILSTNVHESAKLDRLDDLIDEIVAQGNKVVVFSTFKETLGEVERRLNQRGINNVVCHGDIKAEILQERKDYFQENDNCKVMLATWQKMGTGFTLTAANYAIFIDTPFTDGLFQQAADRIYRIGAKNNVTIITLITKNTIDERVEEIIERKAFMSDFVIDGNINKETATEFINFLLK